MFFYPDASVTSTSITDFLSAPLLQITRSRLLFISSWFLYCFQHFVEIQAIQLYPPFLYLLFFLTRINSIVLFVLLLMFFKVNRQDELIPSLVAIFLHNATKCVLRAEEIWILLHWICGSASNRSSSLTNVIFILNKGDGFCTGAWYSAP